MISNIYDRLITHDKQVDNFFVKFKFHNIVFLGEIINFTFDNTSFIQAAQANISLHKK